MVFQDYKFFDENSTETEAVLNNVNCDELVLSVVPIGNATIDITVEGALELAEDNYEEIAILNTKDFETDTHITEGGNYICLVSGLSKIKCVNNGSVGSVNVYGKLVM